MLDEAKEAILSVEPEAEVYLFGSRARGDFNEESDWDLSVLLPGESDWRRKSNVIGAVHGIELKYLEIFNVIVYIKDYWMKNRVLQASPSGINVRKDLVPV